MSAPCAPRRSFAEEMICVVSVAIMYSLVLRKEGSTVSNLKGFKMF